MSIPAIAEQQLSPELSTRDFKVCAVQLAAKFAENVLDIAADLDSPGGDERVKQQIRQWWTDITGERMERQH